MYHRVHRARRSPAALSNRRGAWIERERRDFVIPAGRPDVQSHFNCGDYYSAAPRVASRLVCSRPGNARKCHPRPARVPSLGTRLGEFSVCLSVCLSLSLSICRIALRGQILEPERELGREPGCLTLAQIAPKSTTTNRLLASSVRLDNGGSCVNPKSGLARTRCRSTRGGLALRLLCTLARRHYYPVDERYSGRTASNPRPLRG